MRIGELARLSGMRPATLRYYEGRGLLSPPSRTASGYRSYTPESAAQLRLIRWAKGLGFTLREIREIREFRGGSPSDKGVGREPHAMAVRAVCRTWRVYVPRCVTSPSLHPFRNCFLQPR